MKSLKELELVADQIFDRIYKKVPYKEIATEFETNITYIWQITKNHEHICPFCKQTYFRFGDHKCPITPERNIEIVKLRDQSNINKTDVCKRLCCSLTRDLAKKRLTEFLMPEEIESINQIIKQIEKQILLKTKMTPDRRPSSILGLATLVWSSQTQPHKISFSKVSRITHCSRPTLKHILEYCIELKIVRVFGNYGTGRIEMV